MAFVTSYTTYTLHGLPVHMLSDIYICTNIYNGQLGDIYDSYVLTMSQRLYFCLNPCTFYVRDVRFISTNLREFIMCWK